jgi:glycogen(starch) synthase
MNILLISQDIDWNFGPPLRNLAKGLTVRGHEVHILNCSKWNEERDELHGSVWIHRRRYIRIRGLKRLLSLPVLSGLADLLRPSDDPRWSSPLIRLQGAFANWVHYRRLGIDFDVVETNEHLAEGLLIALLTKTPVVVQIRGPLSIAARYWGYGRPWHMKASDFLERLAARRATLVSAPSRFAAEELVRAGWSAARRARVVYPSTIDASKWDGLSSPAGTDPMVLAVGTIGPLKGSDVLVRAVASLADDVPGLELVFVGRPSPHPDGINVGDQVAGLARELGVRCRFVGQVTSDELREWYGRSRLVALPGRFDTFAKVGLEALAAGRAFVCSTRTGIFELAEESRGAVLVAPAEDPESLADLMKPLLLDPERAAELGRRGRAFVDGLGGPHEWAARKEAQVYREAIRLAGKNDATAGNDRKLRAGTSAVDAQGSRAKSSRKH